MYLKKHIFNKKIFKMYDVRGIFEDELNPEDAYFIGLSFGVMVFEKFGKKRISIAYDARKESLAMKENLINGILDSGCDVLNFGLTTSPMLSYFTMKNDGFGITITASHNPLKYTGFKITMNEDPFFGEELLKIYEIAENGLKIKNKRGEFINLDKNNEYLKEIFSKINLNQKVPKMIIDSLNGATFEIMNLLKNEKYLDFKLINTKFIDEKEVSPDPTKEENLLNIKNQILENNFDIGFAFDGDGDRLVVVDKNCKTLPTDHLLIIFIREVLKKNKGKKIAFDVKCSKILEKEVIKNGGIPVISKTGHSFLKNIMNEDEDIVFACEGSGHIYFKDKYFGFDDAIYAALRLLEIMSEKKTKNVNELTVDIEKTIKKDEKIMTKEKESIMAKIINHFKNEINHDIGRILTIDGVKIEMKNGSWVLIRQSNTEECIGSSYEAFNAEDFKKIEKFYNEIINKFK